MARRKTKKKARARPVEHPERLSIRVPNEAMERWTAAAERARSSSCRNFSDWVRQTLDEAAARR